MNGYFKLAVPLVAALAIVGCNAGTSSTVPGNGGASQMGSSAFTHQIPEWQAKHLARATCPQVVGRPTCWALLAEKHGVVPAACSPSSSCGWTPAQLQAAYNLTPSLGKGSGTKVAVIEAGDDPDAATTLSTYRTQYSLGTATFFKYNESGQQSNYPPSCEDYGWCVETDLDIEMVSASCPKCTIFLMEAKGGINDFEAAEAEAVTLGATVISNSWSCPNSWDCGDTNFPNFFNTPGIAYLASTGDDAYNSIGGPSVLGSVIAVGGTQLALSGSTYSETVWDDASAGCGDSAVVGANVPKPSWQHDPDCSSRTDGDVSSESGCSPGVSEYAQIYGGWFDVCGTSVASPFLAGVIALAGNAAQQNGGENFWKLNGKQHRTKFHDIKSGSDGSCGGTYLCMAGVKTHGSGYKTYAAPVGWGSPKGIKGF